MPNHWSTFHDLNLAPTTSDFETSDLIAKEGKNPSAAQIEGFYRSLVSNTIIILPTGCGKTFIASLVMHRLRRMNPHRIAVMVVGRIPLVYQQTSAIISDTGMNVCVMCGEKSSKGELKRLSDGYYDALVITAGCLYNLLQNEKAFVSLDKFSVMVLDECHCVFW
jgi:ERCC4-related helicase